MRVIAIVGCDGSGKSTLTASLVNELAARMPTEHIYLGQSSGRIGEWISQLPVIGAPFGRYLRSKAAHVHEKPLTPPGNITALVIYLLSCWRAYKFRKMLCKSQQGYLLIQAHAGKLIFQLHALVKQSTGLKKFLGGQSAPFNPAPQFLCRGILFHNMAILIRNSLLIKPLLCFLAGRAFGIFNK